MKDLVEIRGGCSGDESFIMNSWLKSYRDSEATAPVPKHTYYVRHHALATSTLARSMVYVAVSKEDKDHIYGWICVEPATAERTKTLHYLYVKHPYRGFGIAKMLLAHALEEELFSFSHLPEGKFYRLLSKHGHYDPYRFLTGGV